MALQPVVELAPIAPTTVTPSVTSLQLLGNLCLVRNNLQKLGKTEVIAHLDRYIDQLLANSADPVTFIDYATAAVHWVYRVLAPDERMVIFQGYCAISDGCACCPYAPKAEVAFFYQVIEPRIAEVSGLCRELAVTL